MECDANFYGVYIPNEFNCKNHVANVFTDKLEALKLIKVQKKARFKVFRTREEAADFSINGSEQLYPEPIIPPPITKVPNNAEFKFRGPSSQALVQFRKLIENDNLMMVKKTVWDNPRYLISSGDTPSILKEGQRYNALHIAAISKNARMCELILDTVSDICFITLAYGEFDSESCQDRANKLLDLYLNTPDKGLNETPLHFAVKFGAADCVDVLTTYPTCDRNLRNKFGALPKEMICLRLSESDPEVVRRITAALAPIEEQYFVPVVRSDDDTLIPEIGVPFNACSPPKLNDDPLSPRVNVYAFAGPMEISTAQSFRKKWKTPPRLITNRNEDQKSLRKILNDSEKGLERIGRELAQQYEIGWKEFWPFLNAFVDLNTTEGLDLLEKHLELRSQTYWNSKQKTEECKSIENNNITSPMSELCQIFENCKITDSSALETEKSYLCVTKSLQVYAERIYHILRKRSLDLLKLEIRHLISLISSYKSDNGFAKIPFEFVHLRIAEIISEKLSEEDGRFVEVLESLDQNGNTDIVNEHINCILRYIREGKGGNIKSRTEDECKLLWSQGGNCCKCSWMPDDTFRKKRTRSLNSGRCGLIYTQNESDIRPRRLFVDDDDLVVSPDEVLTDSSSDEEDERFFTPPTTPDSSVHDDEASEDEMMDTTHDSAFDIFLEDAHPTKRDADVYYAIRNNQNVTSERYPYIYRWKHTIELYSETERDKWQNLFSKEVVQSPVQTPSKSRSWLQLTGINSPISSPIRTPPTLNRALVTPIKSLK